MALISRSKVVSPLWKLRRTGFQGVAKILQIPSLYLKLSSRVRWDGWVLMVQLGKLFKRKANVQSLALKWFYSRATNKVVCQLRLSLLPLLELVVAGLPESNVKCVA